MPAPKTTRCSTARWTRRWRTDCRTRCGLVASERAIVAHVGLAQAHGADIRARERVLDWSPDPGGEGVTVVTDKGRYRAARLVLTAGAWAGELARPLARLAVPERQVLAWLQPQRPEWFQPDRFPVFNLAVDEGRYYGLPVYEVPGFKFGRYHHLGESGSTSLREPDAADEALLRAFAERYFPDGSGPTMALRACMFTNTPDEHFILDHHPDHPQVVLASPCSGHGYKFCSVVGEVLADLATGDGTTRHDIGFLRLARLG
jgi:sarcosine oxidase